MYTVFMTQKGMVRFCDLESSDCMVSLLLSLSTPSVTRVVIFVSHVFYLTDLEKKETACSL